MNGVFQGMFELCALGLVFTHGSKMRYLQKSTKVILVVQKLITERKNLLVSNDLCKNKYKDNGEIMFCCVKIK